MTFPAAGKAMQARVVHVWTEVLPRDVGGRLPPSLVIAFRPRDL